LDENAAIVHDDNQLETFRKQNHVDLPTIDELLADDGAKLRAAVEAAKQLCLATVREVSGT